MDTLLFLDHGKKPLGKIFDVLGQIANPLYCVRFNSSQQIKDLGITIGMLVYCAPRTEHTSFVILSNLMTRGSDASWEHDVEPSPNQVEYSDDEEERAARRANKRPSTTPGAGPSSSYIPPNRPQANITTRRGGRGSFRGGNNMRQQFRPQFNPNYSWHQNYQQNAGPSVMANPYETFPPFRPNAPPGP